MAEMKLTLELLGVDKLLKAITKLNSALSTLNSVLSRTATGINAIANKLNGIQVPKVGKPPVLGGPANPATPGAGGGNSPQDLNSLLFSVFSGAWKNVLAKLATRFIPSLNLSALQLSKLSVAIGIAYVAVMALVKGFGMVNDVLNSLTDNYNSVKYATGSNASHMNAARRIADATGLADDKVAKDIASNPAGFDYFIQKLKILNGMPEGEAKRITARNMHMEDYQNISNVGDDEWRRIKEGDNSGMHGFDTASKINQKLNSDLSKMSRMWLEYLTPVLVGLKMMATWSVIVATWLMTWPQKLSIAISTWLREKIGLKPLNDSAKNLDSAADKLNDAAYAIKEGAFGGGERFRNAIPNAWSWNASLMINNSRNLGAFEY
jgi:hypothetical protein